MKTLLVATLFILPSFLQSNKTIVDPRDGNEYTSVQIGSLLWMKENMRFQTKEASQISYADRVHPAACGYFYGVEETSSVCPKGWRLPTEKEVKQLLKLAKKQQFDVVDTLQINYCGRVDGLVHAKSGEQNTLWIDAPLQEGSITHWHQFKEGSELHTHNVVNAARKFPVRCVCEAVE